MTDRALEEFGRLPTPNQPTGQTNRLIDVLQARNSIFELDGTGEISDHVLEGLTPVVRKVYLLDKRHMGVVRCTVSAEDGSYAFTGLNTSLKFLAIAIDHTLNYEPATADNLTPEI